MLNGFTYFRIFGLPLIAYLGIIAYGTLIAAAYTGVKNKSIKIHKSLATIGIIFATIHASLAVLAFF